MKSKADKRMEAEARQEEYNKLSVRTKIAWAKSARGNCKKQLAKLSKIQEREISKQKHNTKKKK